MSGHPTKRAVITNEYARVRSRTVMGMSSVLAVALALLPAGAIGLPNPSVGPTLGGTVTEIDGSDYGFVDATIGQYAGFAITSDGRVFANGFATGNGILGTGSTTWVQEVIPVEVPAPPGVRFAKVVSGNSSAFAIGDDGALYSWGANDYGELGDGTTASHASPEPVAQGQIPDNAVLTHVDAGLDGSTAFGDSVIALADGWAYTWGEGLSGQIGDGSTASRTSPVRVSRGEIPADAQLVSVATAGSSMYALADNGKVYAWGSNSDGQLGNGTTVGSLSPVAVLPGEIPSGVRITAIVAGSRWVGALGDDGQVYTWGRGVTGVLGNGSFTSSSEPKRVQAGEIPPGSAVTSIAAGQNQLFATVGGQVYAWGANTFGQLGDGSTVNRSTPVAVEQGAMPAGVTIVSVASGYWSTRGVGSDGKIYVWGENWGGQYGNGSSSGSSASPVLGPNFAVSGVTFDSIPGTGLTATATGVNVVTPPHAEGYVDVEVALSVYGGATPGTATTDPVVYVDGFRYIAPPVIITLSLTNGTVNTTYSDQVDATSSVSVTFSVTGGTLPPGLSINPNTGAVSGTPTSSGTYSFTVTATNLVGADQREYTVVIEEISTPTPTPTPNPTPETSAPPTPDATPTAAVGAEETVRPGELAHTGGEPPWLFMFVGATLILGGVVLSTRRRRSNAPPTLED